MGIAANAVADLAGPPPLRAAANAPDHSPDAPSFQDQLSAADRTAPDGERAQMQSDARPQPTPQQPTPQQSSGPDHSSERSEQSAARAQSGQAEEDHADSKSDAVNPPIFLQLIANAIAPILGAKAAQSAAEQQNPQPTPAEQAAAQASKAQAMSAPAAALANTAAPIKFAPKADAGARPTQVRPTQGKTAKGATEKTQATTPANAAPNGAASPPQHETAAPVTAAANLAALGRANTRGDAKSNPAAGAIEGVEPAPARAGPSHAPRQAAPPAPSAPAPPAAPETALAANSAEAKPRDAGKALALPEALKQAAQDFAPAAPKVQASLSTQAATLSAHPQPATPAASGAGAANARAETPPVALQVGGEIIRRFNGTDTSFQLRLDPPDLGRVDVRLDVSRDHRVTAVFSADSPQALSDLARGARDLQLALQSAGLDLADDGLRFDLSSNGQGNAFAQAQAQQDQPGFRAANAAPAETSIAPELTAQRPLSIDSWRGARVDLMA